MRALRWTMTTMTRALPFLAQHEHLSFCEAISSTLATALSMHDCHHTALWQQMPLHLHRLRMHTSTKMLHGIPYIERGCKHLATTNTHT